MAELTRISLSINVLEQAMGLPDGAKIARVDLDPESATFSVLIAYEQPATPVVVSKFADIGVGFLPTDQIPENMKYQTPAIITAESHVNASHPIQTQ